MNRYIFYACVLLASTLAASNAIVMAAEQTQPGEFEEADDVLDAAAEALAARDSEAILATLGNLESAALYEPDGELRGQAISEVASYRHNSAVAILIKAAASDSEPGNRLQAVEALWYSAADGLNVNGAISAALQTALDDPDERVAATAGRAIADLAALAQSQ